VSARGPFSPPTACPASLPAVRHNLALLKLHTALPCCPTREDPVAAQRVDSIMTDITALLDDYRLLRSVRRGLRRAPARAHLTLPLSPSV
jgi:hypothetical protein